MSQYVSIISMSRPAFFAEAACGPTLHHYENKVKIALSLNKPDPIATNATLEMCDKWKEMDEEVRRITQEFLGKETSGRILGMVNEKTPSSKDKHDKHDKHGNQTDLATVATAQADLEGTIEEFKLTELGPSAKLVRGPNEIQDTRDYCCGSVYHVSFAPQDGTAGALP